MFCDWGHYFNNNICDRGRLWLFWNKQDYSTTIIDAGNQWIHTRILEHAQQRSFCVTFVYALNLKEGRTELQGKN